MGATAFCFPLDCLIQYSPLFEGIGKGDKQEPESRACEMAEVWILEAESVVFMCIGVISALQLSGDQSCSG